MHLANFSLLEQTQINRALTNGAPSSIIQNIMDNDIQNRQWISIFRQGWPDELNFIIKKAPGWNHKGTTDKNLN